MQIASHSNNETRVKLPRITRKMAIGRNDESFLMQYLDQELATELNLFTYSMKGKKDAEKVKTSIRGFKSKCYIIYIMLNVYL